MIAPETFKPNMLVEHLTTGIVYKLSGAYALSFTATQVYPIPGRTTVHAFAWNEGNQFREPSNRRMAEYERAWGIRG